MTLLHTQPPQLTVGQTEVRLAYDFEALTPAAAVDQGEIDQMGRSTFVDTYFDTTLHGGRPCGAVECYTVLQQGQPLTLKGRISVDDLLEHLGAGHDLLIARGEQGEDGTMTIREVRLVVCEDTRLERTRQLLAEMDPRVMRRIDGLLDRSLHALTDLN